MTADENSLQLPPRAPTPCAQRRERAKAWAGKSLRGLIVSHLHVNAQRRRRDVTHKTSGIDTFPLVDKLSHARRCMCLSRFPRQVCPAHVFASLNEQQRAQTVLRSPRPSGYLIYYTVSCKRPSSPPSYCSAEVLTSHGYQFEVTGAIKNVRWHIFALNTCLLYFGPHYKSILVLYSDSV